ncbi:MAG: cyanoexosortase B system-associated protein [Microcoleus sp.]|jgi:cyanoexosortase B-associated protein
MKQIISSLKLLRRYQLSKIVVLAFLLVLVAAVAIPGYATGRWPWTNPPPVANLKQLKSLRQHGMTLPDWQVIRVQNNVQIGGHRWLVEEIQNHQTMAILLLLPQNDPKNQPQVEWLDIDGFHRWQTDSHRTLRFTVKLAKISDKPSTVEARFFRSWTPQQTFAVVQWYAWSNGGSPATSRWFWEDNIARLSNRRASWVAVSIIVPILPQADIKIVEPLLESLGQTVQAQLMAEIF